MDEQFQSLEKELRSPAGIVVDYPLNGTVFPPEFPAPLFLWSDTVNWSVKWQIRLYTQSGRMIHRGIVKSREWRPDPTVWQKIKSESASAPVSFAVIGIRNLRWGGEMSSGKITFSFSQDSVRASVFYRAVPLPFGYAVKNVHEIEWYSGGVDGSRPQKILDNIPVCANCHSFSAGGQIAMDVDYANDKGSYMISDLADTVHITTDKIITWSDYRREDGGTTYGLLSQISPDGRQVVSMVKDRSVFVAVDNLEYSQLFFPIKGILAVYDRLERQFHELPGAADRQYVQSNPNWSPDGNEIIFSRAVRYMSSRIEKSESVLLKLEDAEEFVKGRKGFRYDLCRLPFNGGAGGEAVPVEGASGNGKSNYFARYSPDGKWIVFCQASNFMLLQPDSKLFIMPAGGGQPRLMNCNTGNMNSWHSWSPNSRWLVFSSKNRGSYTQLYLTHVDENGNDSPPVFLENLAFETRAANIPEFFTDHYHFSNMTDDFSHNAVYYNRLATAHILDKMYTSALVNLELALKTDSAFYEAYKSKLYINMVLSRSNSREDLQDRKVAMDLIQKLILQNPGDHSLRIKRGELRLLAGDFKGAIQDATSVLKVNSGHYGACELISKTYQSMGKWDEAITWLKKMLALQPDKTHETYNLAIAYRNSGDVEKALGLLNEIIGRYPNDPLFYDTRAGLYIQQGNLVAAKADYDRAVSADSLDFTAFRERGLFFKNNASPGLAMADFNKAIELVGVAINKNPQDVPLQIQRAEIMESAGNFNGAEEEYDKILKKWPIHSAVLKKKAMRYFSQKQWEQAIQVYTLLVENYPGDSRVLSNRALAWQQTGHLPEALKDLTGAIQLEPGEYAYYYFRAGIRNQTGDTTGARNDLSASASLLEKEQRKRKLEKAEEDMLSAIQKQLNRN